MQRPEEARRLVRHGADQQTSSRTTFARKPIRVRIPLLDHQRTRRDEVVEGVLLVPEATVVVPGPTELLATADVRDGEDDATVEPGQPGDENHGSVLTP